MILSPRTTKESFRVTLTNAFSFSSSRRETRTSVISIMEDWTSEPSLGVVGSLVHVELQLRFERTHPCTCSIQLTAIREPGDAERTTYSRSSPTKRPKTTFTD